MRAGRRWETLHRVSYEQPNGVLVSWTATDAHSALREVLMHPERDKRYFYITVTLRRLVRKRWGDALPWVAGYGLCLAAIGWAIWYRVYG